MFTQIKAYVSKSLKSKMKCHILHEALPKEEILYSALFVHSRVSVSLKQILYNTSRILLQKRKFN